MKLKILILILLVAAFCYVNAQTMSCDVPLRSRTIPTAQQIAATPSGLLCSEVFVQVDYGIVQYFGLQGAKDEIESLLSEVSVPFLDIDVELSWNVEYLTAPTYTPGGSYEMLVQFQQKTPVFDGDVATLLYLDSSGGIAWVNTSCKENNGFRYSFSNIQTTHRPYRDGYSWSVMVIAHELGHNYGSPHTHDPAWNGNGTPIDRCASGEAPIPSEGGTIMSYCHLNSVGINFNRGFHPQAAALIRANIYNRCLNCDAPDNDGEDEPPAVTCNENEVYFDLILDAYPDETSYKLTDSEGAVLLRSPAFNRGQVGQVVSDTLCLPDGCYTYVITDSTGLAAVPCLDGFFYIGDNFGEIASGQDFTGSQTVQFCLGKQQSGCSLLGPNNQDLLPYSNQDQSGGVSVYGENFVKLKGNTWKAQPISYGLTPNSILRAQVKIDKPGEIAGIGLVASIYGLAPANTFRFGGRQSWGIPIGDIAIGEWVDIEIEVGAELPAVEYTYLLFVNDDDAPGATPEVAFRNIELCESKGLKKMRAWSQVQGTVEDEALTKHLRLIPYPNPVKDTLNLPFIGPYWLFGAAGKLIDAAYGDTVDFSLLPPGFYFLHHGGKTTKIVK